MKPLETQTEVQIPNWDYAMKVPVKDNLIAKTTIKGSQFAQPLLNSLEHVQDVAKLHMLNCLHSCLEIEC